LRGMVESSRGATQTTSCPRHADEDLGASLESRMGGRYATKMT